MARTTGLLLLFLCAASWFPLDAAGATEKLGVLTTTLPVWSLVSLVAGDYARVENLIPPGIEPHDFQITGREIRKLHQASLIFINGLRLEDWLDRYLKVKETETKIVVVSSGLGSEIIDHVTPLLGSTVREGPRFPNPHFWLDPVLAKYAVTNILRALQTADPAHSADFQQNAGGLIRQLDGLDADYSRELSGLRDHAFVTSHDFFAYPARRYHLKLAGVVETDAEVEPSLHYAGKLAAMIHREKAGVIFIESHSSSRLVDQLCEDLGILKRELSSIEVGPVVATVYLDEMRLNLGRLKEGLSGK